MAKANLTAQRLRELLHYDPETGVFTRRVQSSNIHAGTRAGCRTGYGYLCIRVDNRLFQAHRLAWLYVTGEWPMHSLDHINRIRDDNRFANLRDVQHKTNMQNLAAGKGVSFFKRDGTWRAYIGVDGRFNHIGYFATREEAANAAEAARRIHHPGFVG